MSVFQVIGDLPLWTQMFIVLLSILLPAVVAFIGGLFASSHKRMEAKVRRDEADLEAKAEHDKTDVERDKMLGEQLLTWSTQLQGQLNRQADRIVALEDAQKELQDEVYALKRENHALKLWAKALFRQLEDASITPADYEQFMPNGSSNP